MKILESTKPRVAGFVSRAALSSLRAGTRLFNPLTLALAGSRHLPLFAVVHHRGRRSGRSYTTPVGARRTTDGFVIPLTFGERADWFRNVQAAGACVIRWKGADYPVIEPAVVDWATAWSAFYPVERVLVPLIGIKQFVRLRNAPANSPLSQT
jgi:deazaflavin-dependent oxidoreductase (nitroreductase family)